MGGIHEQARLTLETSISQECGAILEKLRRGRRDGIPKCGDTALLALTRWRRAASKPLAGGHTRARNGDGRSLQEGWEEWWGRRRKGVRRGGGGGYCKP
jgi:hypothetical protein